VSRIDISYVEMMTSSGSPIGSCTIAVGTTEYITLSGVGSDPANAGAQFVLSLITADGGYASVDGAFG